jgi:hypothetical protein
MVYYLFLCYLDLKTPWPLTNFFLGIISDH